MKFGEEEGVALTDDLRSMVRQGITLDGGREEFAAAAGTSVPALQTWTGNGQRRSGRITWATWEGVRRHLAQLRLLDPADPHWMLPSELRAEVFRLRAIVAANGSHTTISAGDGAAVANGSHASAQATTPSSAEERAAERLDRLAAWILASGLSPDEKLAALAIAHG